MHVQRKFWKRHGKTSLCWAYYCVIDNTYVDLENPWIMRYILCHNNPINAMNLKTQAKRGLISCFKTNGTLNKHADADHGLVAKIFEEKVNNFLRGKEERHP